jgi:hypothetical protein
MPARQRKKLSPKGRELQLASQRRWSARNKVKVLADRLRAYDLTLTEFDAMVEKQGNLCAIRHKPERMTANGVTLRLAVDHCHETNKVRGLLCARCNMMLGYAKDSVVLLATAIAYLGGSHGD